MGFSPLTINFTGTFESRITIARNANATTYPKILFCKIRKPEMPACRRSSPVDLTYVPDSVPDNIVLL